MVETQFFFRVLKYSKSRLLKTRWGNGNLFLLTDCFYKAVTKNLETQKMYEKIKKKASTLTIEIS